MRLTKNKPEIKTLTEWWKAFLKIAPPPISDWVEKETQWLENNIKGSTVLDVGCGWGDGLKTIARNINKGVGIDSDKKAIKEARENLHSFKNVKLFLRNAKELNFKNNIFDYILCFGNTFGNLGKDKFIALKEMKKVMKNKGKIIISVYSERALPIRIKTYQKVDVSIGRITEDGTVYVQEGMISEQFSKNKLKKIFRKAGLNVEIKKLNPISYICIATKK